LSICCGRASAKSEEIFESSYPGRSARDVSIASGDRRSKSGGESILLTGFCSAIFLANEFVPWQIGATM
jgi:hypothetical protein